VGIAGLADRQFALGLTATASATLLDDLG